MAEKTQAELKREAEQKIKIEKYRVLTGEKNRTTELKPDVITYLVDTGLSKPTSKRFSSKYNGLTIDKVFSTIFSKVPDNQVITIDNGTYECRLPKNEWMNFFSLSLSLFIQGKNVTVSGYEKTFKEKTNNLIALD